MFSAFDLVLWRVWVVPTGDFGVGFVVIDLGLGCAVYFVAGFGWFDLI